MHRANRKRWNTISVIAGIILVLLVAGLMGCRGPKPTPKTEDDPASSGGGGRAITPGHLNDPSGGGPSNTQNTGNNHYTPGIGQSGRSQPQQYEPGTVDIEIFYMGRKLNLNEPFRVIDTMEYTLNIYFTAEGSELSHYDIYGAGPGAPRVNEQTSGYQQMVEYTFTYQTGSWGPNGITIQVYNQNYRSFVANLQVQTAEYMPGY
jgi:hypothetical protein